MNTKRVLTDRDSAVPALAEAFREHGFEGASLATLSKTTGLGKGSLYNFFPGGKAEMMDAVLEDIDRWFSEMIFSPLEHTVDPTSAVTSMMQEVAAYFRSGRRVCLVGSLGLNTAGEAFKDRVAAYFARWISALAKCLEAGKIPPVLAAHLAEDTICTIQGAIVLARGLGEEATFTRIIERQRAILLQSVARDRKISRFDG
ncbi:TetR/AcrR family transcriptional regulator [Novosphingobium sp. Leaf2]|uniref:TetR/AcrR family transcriptional regulator n=1 Tax=Novosphingobium sp. Leaf2 TaxID=1735670 RepID=UPI0006FFC685|nr:TetR/AcrR family transcriptional regulator [Novosphingobium sp. Leaf2]KQM19595.1 TetR family transcriptional regulator [Novosphingobium sp. Leaf2]